MKYLTISITLILFLAVSCLQDQTQDGTISYTVSMDNPNTHYFRVDLHCSGIGVEIIDLKMPAWTPGYYWILDFAKNVANFKATDGAGNPLEWHKVNKNTWRIETGQHPDFEVSYDVFAFHQSVAEPFLDDGRAFISPTGVFMYADDLLEHPVTVTVTPFHEWNSVNTGLDQVEDQSNTFYADNFDILYDCPILAGKLEVFSFEVEGIEHTMAFENPIDIDRQKYTEDLKNIVINATGIIGEIPYDHYTFLFMGRGGGGLEHSNSMAVFSNLSYDITQSDGYKRWLAFIAHEYFHLYNVKTIRPVALGPFDYDRENYTNMLWVSEGMTVYYEYIILNRAGFMDRQETLDAYSRTISSFENLQGRELQSATSSSFDTWLNFFNRSNHTANTTISYYDIGCALGLLLDLKIRHETEGSRSLDDLMKELYYTWHKKLDRGFTDEEFRKVCETVAGCSLEEIFNYAENPIPIDYQKYLDYAGIQIDTEPDTLPGAGLGFRYREHGEGLMVTYVERDSPAWEAGLSVEDQVLEVNRVKATSEVLKDIAESGDTGKLVLLVKRRTGERQVEFIPGIKSEKSYKMTPLGHPDEQQVRILDGWLKDVRSAI